MALTIPNYLKAANIQDNSIRYAWDDWKTLPVEETPNEEVVGRLERVSQRAGLAFMAGTAEWIVYRFAKLCDTSDPWNYLEAAWAMIIDVRYYGYGKDRKEFTAKGWEGPVKGPIVSVLLRLGHAIEQLFLEGAEPARHAGLAASLAVYIMNDPTPYKQWSQQILDRLESLYQRHPEDEVGDVVPRQAIDPELDFHVDQTETAINHFLRSLDYRANPFLSTPEGMLTSFEPEDAFVGIPYTFNIESDRLARRTQKETSDGEDEGKE
jgi:hypothetical protein